MVGYQESRKDMQAVCGLAEDIRDTVIEYQVGPNPSIPSGCPVKMARRFTNKKCCTTRTVN